MKFKNTEDEKLFEKLDQKLKDALTWCDKRCEERKLPFVITRTISEMIAGVSKTNIHASGRAVDVSIKGWNADEIDEFIFDSNKQFAGKIGAISQSDGVPRFCVYHVGTGYHLHLQVRRS